MNDYRTNAREQSDVIRKSRVSDRLLNSAPLRRLAFDVVVAAPALTIATIVIRVSNASGAMIVMNVVLALLMYALLCVLGILPVGALYDKMDSKIATSLSLLIAVYSPLTLLLLVGHWTVTGRWLPARWSAPPK